MKLTLDQALQEGVAAHKAGKINEAETYYVSILKFHPGHHHANHNMGVLLVGIGKTQDALPFFRTALDAKPEISQFWMSYINALLKLNLFNEALFVLNQAKGKITKGDSDELERQISSRRTQRSDTRNSQEISNQQFKTLDNFLKNRNLKALLEKTSVLRKKCQKSARLHNFMGLANAGLGNFEVAVDNFKMAVSLKPDFIEAEYNLGNSLKNNGDFVEAIKVYKKVLAVKPNSADVYNNMGNAYHDHGFLEKAVKAYERAISINPNYFNAYNNLGNVLKNQGKNSEAISAYEKALTIKPKFADIYRIISTLKSYSKDDQYFIKVIEILKDEGLTADSKSKLSFGLAKMYDDIGDYDKAFEYFSVGNKLRKKLFDYKIERDEVNFQKLKSVNKYILKNSLTSEISPAKINPIFIIGMPRSGTTLIEQIISSHSKITGAGELYYLSKFASDVLKFPRNINKKSIFEFRQKYLIALSKVSEGKHFVSDKMPQNFLFVPLICAALPEARIIHVEREAPATCWSIFKSYFAANAVEFAYDLQDIVSYYRLYRNLMHYWCQSYKNKIYNVNYDKLTNDVEIESKKLVDYVGLEWDIKCLSPHENKRPVRTVSQQQVRQKIYRNSSQTWKNYEKFLNGMFDDL